MKKNLWLLGVAVAALSSCTQSEVLDVPESKKITFDSFVEKNTRAVNDVDSKPLLTNFWVFGYCTPNNDPGVIPAFPDDLDPVFDGSEELVQIDNLWGLPAETPNPVYWKTDHSYRFAAYSNGNTKLNNVTYDATSDQLTILSYSVIDATEDAEEGNDPKDLLGAISGDKHSSTNATAPNLNFRHLLSKITISINNASEQATMNISSAVISYMNKTGKCVCDYVAAGDNAYPANVNWSELTNAVDFDLGTLSVQKGHTDETLTFYVIPQDNTNVKLTMSWTEDIGTGAGSAHNTVENAVFDLASGTTNVRPSYQPNNRWVPGYHYRYVLVRGTNFGQIKFNVQSVDRWNSNLDGTEADNDYVEIQQ